MPHLHHGASGSLGSVLLTVIIVLTAVIYLRGWLRLRSASFLMVRPWRAFSFTSGLVLIWVATASSVAVLDHELLTVHMLKHLLLMTLAPPLIWLGEPVRLLWQGLSRQFVELVLSPAFQWPPMRRIGRLLGQPQFCWLVA